MIFICNLLSGCPNAEVRFAPEQRPDPNHWSCADFRVFVWIAAYFKQTNRRTEQVWPRLSFFCFSVLPFICSSVSCGLFTLDYPKELRAIFLTSALYLLQNFWFWYLYTQLSHFVNLSVLNDRSSEFQNFRISGVEEFLIPKYGWRF